MLSTHPDVAAVAIVPRADHVMGEIGVAVVVPRDPARAPTLDELRDVRRRRTSPPTSCPRRSIVRAELPLTAGEKVDRRALVAELSDPVA